MAASAAASAKSSSSRSVTSRRRGRRRGLSGARIAWIVVAALALLYVGWWAVKAAAVNYYTQRNVFLARTVAPGDPRPAMRLAVYELQQRNGRVDDADRQRAIAALARSALADEPFLLAALTAAVAHDEAREEALLTESRRRNPRSRFTRLLLLDLYMRHGRSAEAGSELAVLTRLIPQAGGALVPELSRLARDARTRPGLAQMLRRNPEVRDLTLANLAAREAPDLVVALARETGSGSDPAHPPRWQSVLLGRLVDTGDVEQAYRLWLSAAGVAGDPGAKGVYDGNFAGAPGAAPFNWDLNSDAEGVAERGRGSLQVDYYGRAPRLLARQLLILKPGSYKLQFRAEGAAKGDGSRLLWSVGCLGGKEPLVRLPLTDVGAGGKALSAAFAIPAAGCRAQWLALQGEPGEMSTDQNATITNVQILPGGGK
jgi:hypothetical protein